MEITEKLACIDLLVHCISYYDYHNYILVHVVDINCMYLHIC